jgi:hypothetical protein
LLIIILIKMDQERAMMIFLSYQKLRMPTFSVRQRRTENPLRERLLVRKFIAQLETYYFYQQQQQQIQWQYYKQQETMASTNTQQDEQISQMDVDQEIHETEDETSNIIDSSASEDEDDSVCSIVMSTSNDTSNSVSLDTSDLMKNYALLLEVPTTLTTTNDQM